MDYVYQFKIQLRDSNPSIWRRIQVAEETTFSELHDIIQLSMGWHSQHLYEFRVNNTRVYDFEDAVDDGENPSERDSLDTFLNELVIMVKSKFTYVYDFGDHWEHEIELEKILPEEKDTEYPNCMAGERACPPEDCGGIWRYQEILNILTNKDHPEYENITAWMGDDWDAALFDMDKVNELLKDYEDQWEAIYQEAGEILEGLGINEDDIDDWEPEEFLNDAGNEYEAQKKLSVPKDVLRDTTQRPLMQRWVEMALEEPISIEYQTAERLRNLGFDEKKTKELIMSALSVECFYDLKYETDHLEDRFAYNLDRLPETPQELPRLEDALAVLDRCKKGVPFLAIEYVQNDSSKEATSAVVAALSNHSDHQYCWGDCSMAPFWYALATEGHLCEELIDPVIQLYEENANDSEWLSTHGQYLIGKLAQKYPDLTADKVLEAMESDAENASKPNIFYLFDAFYFCDTAKYKSRLITLLKRDDLSWYEPLVAIIADIHITEALPVLRSKLEKLKADPDVDDWHNHLQVEMEEAIQILEGKRNLDDVIGKPLCVTSATSWKDELKEKEHLFYQDDGVEDDFDPFESAPDGLFDWPGFTKVEPHIKEKVPRRNDPCHCGSGKKYKKCCMDKDRQDL